jgi:hypothetical protein
MSPTRTAARVRPALLAGALLAAVLVAAPQPGFAIDWATAGAERVVQIVTRNEDGTARETKIWLVVVDGQGYVRTGGTRWWGNIERDPDVVLRVAGAEHPLRAELVNDPEIAAKVEAALRTKYGWSDRLIGPFRFGDTHILRLVPREAGSSGSSTPSSPPNP